MNARQYEVLYIINPELDEAGREELVVRFDEVLKNNGAEISESKMWGKRRLAYEIEGHNEAVYHIVNFAASDSQAMDEFDRLARINDGILRHMIVRREDKE